MTKRIRIDVGIDGNIKAETFGIYGQKCMDYVSVLEDLLEAQAVQSSFNDDYSKTEEFATDEQGVRNEF
jgi:hypothetical protein